MVSVSGERSWARARTSAELDQRLSECAGLRRSASALWLAHVGLGLPRALPRLLAPARQCRLGGHHRLHRAVSRSLALRCARAGSADRHRDRRRHDRRADRVLSAGPRCLSGHARAVGRRLRLRRHGAEQLRVLRGGARRLYRRDRRGRHPRRDRRPEYGCLHAGRHACQRDSASASCRAGIVLAGTDLGGARRRLAGFRRSGRPRLQAALPRMLARAGGETAGNPGRAARSHAPRHRARPVIDQALGEASQLRYHSPTLQGAIHGLFRRSTAGARLRHGWPPLPHDDGGRRPRPSARPAAGAARHRHAEPGALDRRSAGASRACEGAARSLLALPAGTPSLRLLADQTAKLLTALCMSSTGLALLVDAPGRPRRRDRGFRLSVPDFLPALCQRGTGVPCDRSGRALLGRDGMAERGRGHRFSPQSWCSCSRRAATPPTPAPSPSRSARPSASSSRRSSNLRSCRG